MPMKYRQLDSHAGASKPKSSMKPSKYPPKKKIAGGSKAKPAKVKKGY